MGKWEGSEGKAAGVMGEHWEGGKEPVAWMCGHGSRGGGRGAGGGNGNLGKRLGTTVLIYENYGESSFYIWLFFHSGYLDQNCMVMVTLGHRIPDYQTHCSKKSSRWIHICYIEEMLVFVSASW